MDPVPRKAAGLKEPLVFYWRILDVAPQFNELPGHPRVALGYTHDLSLDPLSFMTQQSTKITSAHYERDLPSQALDKDSLTASHGYATGADNEHR